MSSKQEIIKKMIEMQKMFSEYERANGVRPQEYYVPQEGHVLKGYREEYAKLAAQVLAMAHEEVGSHA